MNQLDIVVGAFTFILAGLVWFMKRTLDKVEHDSESNKQDIQKIKDEYLHKNDFKDFKTELRIMFEEIKQDIRDLKK